ncbi:MAG: homing endonuclease associated repeat-containing protein [bacterium]
MAVAPRNAEYHREALVDHLRDVAQSLGRGPTGSDANARAGPCDRTYRNRFGNWGESR